MEDTLYIINVDALGFSGGCALKGEVLKGGLIGTENINRLLMDRTIGIYTPEVIPSEAPSAPSLKDSDTWSAPPQVEFNYAASIALGIRPPDDYIYTQEDISLNTEVKEGVVEMPFNTDAILSETLKVISERIVAFGGEAPKGNTKKSDAVEVLRGLVSDWFAGFEVLEDIDENGKDMPENSQSGNRL